MANLIPPDAKKDIILEYWFRVATIWLLLVGFGLCMVIILKIPTLVLIEAQLRTFSGVYDAAQDKKETFEASETILKDANDISTILSRYDPGIAFSEIISILDEIAGGVAVNSIRLVREESTIKKIEISGIANTRSDLANFSRDIEAHELFEEAELPISNLAKDKDIGFSIDITPSTK